MGSAKGFKVKEETFNGSFTEERNDVSSLAISTNKEELKKPILSSDNLV